MKIAEAQRRQLLLLIALVVAVAALGWKLPASLFGTGGAAEERTVADNVAPLDKKLASMLEIPSIPLERPAGGRGLRRQRNLFEFSQSPEAVAAERARQEAERRAEVERVEREARLARERQAEAARRALLPPEPPPPPPPLLLRSRRRSATPTSPTSPSSRAPEEYLAALQKKEGKPTTAIVKVGDVLDNQFVVKKIDIDQVVVSYTDPRFSDQTQSVRLIPSPPSASDTRRPRRRQDGEERNEECSGPDSAAAAAGRGRAPGVGVRRREQRLPQGRGLRGPRDVDEAVLAYAKANAEDPTSTRNQLALLRAKLRASAAHFDRGRQYLEAGQLELAVKELQETVILDPTNEYARSS